MYVGGHKVLRACALDNDASAVCLLFFCRGPHGVFMRTVTRRSAVVLLTLPVAGAS